MIIDYKQAGVDVEAGYEAVKLMKKHVQRTFNKNVLDGLGSFGGFYALDDKADGDVLVAGTDGAGTKIKLAFTLDQHDTIGIDLVAMCVNDIVCQGAKPLIFLDYIVQSKVIPEKVAQLVKGMSDGCIQAGCALIGGETAEHPGFYPDGEYDLAGFSCGTVKRNKIINGASIKEGDALIGLMSSGAHSNGFSLIRKLFPETKEGLLEFDNELDGVPAEVLMTPTKIYVKTILELIGKFEIKGIAHITGGGFIENIPRIFPLGIGAKIDIKSYSLPTLFKVLAKRAGLTTEKAYNTFNMGVGMVLCVDKKIADKVVAEAIKLGEKAIIIGETIKGSGVVL